MMLRSAELRGAKLFNIASNKKNQSNECLDENSIKTKKNKPTSTGYSNISIYLLICIVGVSLGIILQIVNAQNRRQSAIREEKKLKYWVYSANSDANNKNGLLKHVHLVLERIGYEKSTNYTDWNLLWSHDHPFRVLYPNLHKLKPHQRVNHLPGIGPITSKVDLATSESKYIPKAFKLPENKDEFLKYASENANALFVEKNNNHRGVYLRNVSEINLDSGESFVQQYIEKPFLVDGHKFDIGVYVVVTSVNPLRVYWYKGDVMFRYCPAKYYPFDPKKLDKYVVGDYYLPTWKVPALAKSYTALGFSMKGAFDIYAKSKGKNPLKMWEEVQNAIAEVFVKKEKFIIKALQNYPSSDNFFEMMRFDLIVDENLKVYLLEANMSPNLSSARFPPNQLIYEQVLYNLFSLTGVSNPVNDYPDRDLPAVKNMLSSQKNIAVWGEECMAHCRDQCDRNELCGLCKPCMNHKLRNSLLKAHREYLQRGDFRRLLPPPMKQNSLVDVKDLTPMNKLLHLWYQGKCNMDVTWCS